MMSFLFDCTRVTACWHSLWCAAITIVDGWFFTYKILYIDFSFFFVKVFHDQSISLSANIFKWLQRNTRTKAHFCFIPFEFPFMHVRFDILFSLFGKCVNLLQLKSLRNLLTSFATRIESKKKEEKKTNKHLNAYVLYWFIHEILEIIENYFYCLLFLLMFSIRKKKLKT